MGTEQAAAVEISEPLLHQDEAAHDKITPVDGDGEEFERIPEWKEQITFRGLAVSAILGTLFCIITHKLNLTVGIIPSLNVAAGLLGFFFVKSWTGVLSKLGFSTKPFTRQENTVIQTCVVACYGLAFSGGFGSYLLSMDEKTYKLIGEDYPGNRAEDVKNPGKQVSSLGKYLSISFIWSCFKWFFSGVGDSCDWYPADLGSNDFKGLYGYKVFIAISLILGDGLYNLVKIISVTIKEICTNATKHQNLPIVIEVAVKNYNDTSKLLVEQKKRDKIFLKDGIPFWFAASGYVALVAISTATMPLIFPPLKWYLVLCSYILAPALAFCNSYGTGLTDWSLASTYGKIGLFMIASLVGSHGGVLAGLAACGVMMSIVSTAADLMQDFKTGYLTLSSAKSMFVSQLVGTAMGCIIAPLTFWMYWRAFDIGSPDSPYKAPYAVIYREMAILGVEGFSELPKHCLAICCGFFVAALAINLLRDVVPKRVSGYIPIPMAMAVPFYIGAYFAIDMFVGTVILFVWERINRKDAEDYAGAVASGLICGDGIWTIPSAILSIFRINPPICMYFGPAASG
ncbi:probable metal-nicotianamine transporter ysl4 [Phtheirospermum japonicum]|uniref:Probable metal-nicotianamine transporter ysl4 n=1 Tax=Phtheirospermum japonicum TaxID=374723 RepID=A0A830CJ17_9LAMI|nr:probable metal-nicotianamine transporter ysl4 [Phtheirospermum japonicum]